MRNVALKDLTWLAKIEYRNHPDSILHIAATDAPDILAALAKVQVHIRDCWPYEIISLEQQSNKQIERIAKFLKAKMLMVEDCRSCPMSMINCEHEAICTKHSDESGDYSVLPIGQEFPNWCPLPDASA